MANINNATVKVEGIDPTANAINSRIVADIYGGGQESINGYANGLGNALMTYDRDVQSAIDTGFSDTYLRLDSIISQNDQTNQTLNIFQSTSFRGVDFTAFVGNGSTPADCMSALVTWLNTTSPNSKIHSYQILPTTVALTSYTITALLVIDP